MSLPPPQDPLEEAAAWLARQDAGLTPAEENELDAWLQADERHAAAWAEVQEPWDQLDQARADGMAEWMVMELDRRERRRAKSHRRLVWAAAASLLAAGTFGVAAILKQSEPPAPGVLVAQADDTVASPITLPSVPDTSAIRVLAPEHRVLEDGTVVELDDDALLRVFYTAGERRVRLEAGTAFFKVFHDPERPFIVESGTVRARAVGTAFMVDRSADSSDVLVTEGRVGVSQNAGDATLVEAGQHAVVSFTDDIGTVVVKALTPVQVVKRLQWRQARLQLQAASLPQVIERLNQYSDTPLVIGDARLDQLRFSGLLRADNVAGFLTMLQSNYQVVVVSQKDQIILTLKQDASL